MLTTLNLSQFSERVAKAINLHLDPADKVSQTDIVGVGPGKKALTVKTAISSPSTACVYNPELYDPEEVEYDTRIVPLKEQDAIDNICGLISFSKVLGNAMPYASWEMIEWFLITYGNAWSAGELRLGSQLTEDFIINDEGYEGEEMLAFNIKKIARYVTEEVACNTDAIFRSVILPLGEETREVFPEVFPVLIINGAIFFNQAIPTPHTFIRNETKTSQLPPEIVGSTIFDSLGTGSIKQVGNTATVVKGGKKYKADLLGCRAV